jgi:hypothetical protein
MHILKSVLHNLQFLEWIIHPLPDVFVQLSVSQMPDGQFSINAILLGGTDDSPGNHDRHITNTGDVWVKQLMLSLFGSQRLGEVRARGVNHVLSDIDSLAENGTETNTREDVHIVALAWVQSLSLVFQVGEWRARSKEATAFGGFNGFFECAFGFADWVGEREDDGVVVQFAHLLENLRGKGSADGGETHEDSGLHIVDDVGEALELLAFVVVTRKVDFVVGEGIAAVVRYETLLAWSAMFFTC